MELHLSFSFDKFLENGQVQAYFFIDVIVGTLFVSISWWIDIWKIKTDVFILQ